MARLIRNINQVITNGSGLQAYSARIQEMRLTDSPPTRPNEPVSVASLFDGLVERAQTDPMLLVNAANFLTVSPHARWQRIHGADPGKQMDDAQALVELLRTGYRAASMGMVLSPSAHPIYFLQTIGQLSDLLAGNTNPPTPPEQEVLDLLHDAAQNGVCKEQGLSFMSYLTGYAIGTGESHLQDSLGFLDS